MLEREIREMAYIPRWSIVRTQRQQYLAEHTYFVSMYANDIAVHLGLGFVEIGILLQMCLWHDVEEILSGDLPGPCKRGAMSTETRNTWDLKLKEWLGKVFYRMDLRDGSRAQLVGARMSLLEAILKLADMLDETCELGSEIQMGNSTVKGIFDDSLQRTRNAMDALLKVYTFDSPVAEGRFRGYVIDACLRSRDAESKSTRIFDTL